MQHDLQRRQADYEMGASPQYLDCAIDYCLPKVFDVVNYWKYAARVEEDLGAQTGGLSHILNYHERL